MLSKGKGATSFITKTLRFACKFI